MLSGSSTRAAMRLAALLMIVGFVLMALAWNSAAGEGAVARQIPYLLSGTFPGLALVILGGVIATVVEFRRAAADLATRLEDAMGTGSAPAAGGLTAVPTDGTAVVAGRTTFHVPGCRLVEGRTDLQVMSPADAVDRGLAPCRICEPETPPAPAAVEMSSTAVFAASGREAAEAPPPDDQPVVRPVTKAPERAKKTAAKRAKKTSKKRAKKTGKKTASKRAEKTAEKRAKKAARKRTKKASKKRAKKTAEKRSSRKRSA